MNELQTQAIESYIQSITDILTSEIPGLKTLILGGSFGRGEGTIFCDGSQIRPFKDFDLFAIVQNRMMGRATQSVTNLRNTLYDTMGIPPYSERHPSPGRFQLSIELIPENSLERLPNDISNAELKLASRILWGEDLRPLIPCDLSLIPPVSGLRAMLNKLIGLLELWGPWIESEAAPDPMVPIAIHYHQAKTILDAVSAYLLLRKRWVPGYGERLKILKKELMDEDGVGADWPSRLKGRAERAMLIKSTPLTHPSEDPRKLWAKDRREILDALVYLAPRILGYEVSKEDPGFHSFSRHSHPHFLAPYAVSGLKMRHLPTSDFCIGVAVTIYSAAENFRIGALHYKHPLLRVYAGAWSWAEHAIETMPSDPPAELLPFAHRGDISPGKTRDRIIEFFKTVSTRKRIKRSFL